MRKIILVPILLGIGLVVAGGAIAAVGINKGATYKTETKTHSLEGESITGFQIELETSDLEFIPTTDGVYKVVCQENEKTPHTVEVVDHVLTIKGSNTMKWYEQAFTFDFTRKKVSVYLPSGVYDNFSLDGETGNVKVPHDFSFLSADIKTSTGGIVWKANVAETLNIKASTGNVAVEGIEAKAVKLKSSTGWQSLIDCKIAGEVNLEPSTGDIVTQGLRADSLTINGSTTNLRIEDTILTGAYFSDTSTGGVTFKDSDAATLKVKTSTGDVKGSLLTGKTFKAHSSTGSINIPPDSPDGGLCQIDTSTGDIRITISE